jgi:hypothetical protein
MTPSCWWSIVLPMARPVVAAVERPSASHPHRHPPGPPVSLWLSLLVPYFLKVQMSKQKDVLLLFWSLISWCKSSPQPTTHNTPTTNSVLVTQPHKPDPKMIKFEMTGKTKTTIGMGTQKLDAHFIVTNLGLGYLHASQPWT